ncbi:cytochrome P450 67 [Verticillium dahliae]|nr:cytochrome P450 67 [Verticillium dahliae]
MLWTSTSTGQTAHLTAFTVGALFHILLFRRGEWDNYASRIVLAFATTFSASVAVVFYGAPVPSQDDLWQAVKDVSSLHGALIAGLSVSMVLYRSLFHPLRRFPGPFAAKLSGAYSTRLARKNEQFFIEAKKLHETYGDFVRIGPTEISIAHPTAVQALHANSSPCSKGPWYNTQLPARSVHTTRDREDHGRRRKAWDRGFSSKSLRDYEPRVRTYTNQLLTQIDAKKHGAINVSKEFNLYSFDVMGNLAFGKNFGLIMSQKMHPAMELLQATTALSGMLMHMSWVVLFGRNGPLLTRHLKSFERWLDEQTKERMENEPDIPDVFSWVLGDYRSKVQPTKQDYIDLCGDSMLIVVAGSDTTATSLTCLFLQLTQNPTKCRNLQEEIDKYFADRDGTDHASLAKLPYLQACIDESLRLYPPIPSGLQRLTPPGGIRVENTFIPGDTIVQVPSYTLYRDQRVFPRPDEFVPERWTSKPELVKDKAIFAPFSIGRYSCVGKQLGLMEIRTVTAELLRRYNVSLAPDQSVKAFTDKLVDGFTLTCPKLDIIFTPRDKGSQG